MEGPLPLSCLKLLVPPVRVMSAVMWKVVHLRNVKYYGKVVEFVSIMTEVIPNILTEQQRRLLILGLRVKMMLQMLVSEQSEDLTCIQTAKDSLLCCSPKPVDAGDKGVEANFVSLVERLMKDPKGREHFLMNVFPVKYGPDFDAALEMLVCKFFTRLEELVLIPDFKQTAEWISDSSSVLEEECVFKADKLRELFKSKIHCGKTAKMDASAVTSSSEHQLFSSLSLPPSLQETNISDVESEAQTREKQRVPEGISPQAAEDVGIQDVRLPFEEEADFVCCSNTELAAGDKRSDGIPVVDIVEEFSNPVSAFSHAPSPPTEQLPLPKPMIVPRRQREAHKCPHCRRCFVYRYQLQRHQRRHTGEQPYKCTQCGMAFKRTAGLLNHRRTQCKEAAYVCIKCGDSFQCLQDRRRHSCGLHVQMFDCSQCGKSFKKKSLLLKHEVTHRQNAEFKREQSGKVQTSASELASHQEMRPPNVSGSVASLKATKRRQRQKKTYICVHCGKVCKNKHCLDLHTLNHSGERPFQCTTCGKRFSLSGNLTIHQRIHTGERPYLCSDCGKAFTSAGELHVHQRTHTGEKPYKCTVCDRGFATTSSLSYHKRVHTGERPFVCSECGKGFSRNTILKKHMMKHTGIRPFACQLCPKTYTCVYHLQRHQKTHSF